MQDYGLDYTLQIVSSPSISQEYSQYLCPLLQECPNALYFDHSTFALPSLSLAAVLGCGVHMYADDIQLHMSFRQTDRHQVLREMKGYLDDVWS